MLSQITDRKIAGQIARDCVKIVVNNLDYALTVDYSDLNKEFTTVTMEEIQEFQHIETDCMKCFLSIQLSNGYYMDIRSPIDFDKFNTEFDLLVYTKADYTVGTVTYYGVKKAVKHIAFNDKDIYKFLMKFGAIVESLADKKINYVKINLEL